MSSIFSKIITGEIPCYKISETDSCLAFLDISPLAKGHVLVVPKEEIDNYFDLDPQLYAELNAFAKKIAKALQQTIPCERIGVAIIGLEVAHAHIHLIPINTVGDIDFSKPKLTFPSNEMLEIAKSIIEKL
ncbi:MAG: HIT family protein [Flavobacteriales bacterium]|nr:HIT family protein [Flavobacteriales bacterium]